MDAAFPILLDIFGGTADGAHHPFHLGEPDRALRRRAYRHGADLRRLEQSPLDDHRPLRDRARGGEAMSGKRASIGAASSRRGLAAASTMLLGGCDELSEQPWVRRILDSAETLTRVTPACVLRRRRWRANISEADISPRVQGQRLDRSRRRRLPGACRRTASPIGSSRSAAWSSSRSTFSLAELRAMPSRTQITRHDCVEGWSCIGKWKGVPLGALLETAKLKPERATSCSIAPTISARRATEDGQILRESIELVDAFHPQTILAYEMNDQTAAGAARRAACGCASSGSSATRWRNT